MHGPVNVKQNQQVVPSENRTHYYMFWPLSLAIFREYILKDVYSFVICKW